MKYLTVILSLVIMTLSCTHKNVDSVPATTVTPILGVRAAPGSTVSMIPKATAFKMSGDFADNVAIGIDTDGKLTYYPAPSDLSEDSKPLDLGGGWWLNRQGIGANAVFTKYSFAKYMALESAPSPEELKESIIPGARVTAFERLPFSINEAASHLDEIKNYLNAKK